MKKYISLRNVSIRSISVNGEKQSIVDGNVNLHLVVAVRPRLIQSR